MNGRVYIRSFPDMPTGVSDSLTGTPMDSFGRFVDESATSMLHNLYGLGEADFLSEPTPTNTLDTAKDFLDVQQGIRFLLEEKRRQYIRDNQNGNSHGKLSFNQAQDSTGELAASELEKAIISGQDADKANLRFHATGMLAEAIVHRRRLGERRPAADAVKHAISGKRAVLLSDISKSIFAINQTVDQDGTTQKMEIKTSKTTLRPPNWIRNLEDERSEAIKLLASRGILEYDAYFAMLKWVVDRGLPLIPIPAPPALERTVPGKNEKNPNADFLLCSIETNEVVPIQVKNTVSAATRDSYFDWMQFITPSNLGIVEMLGAQPVRNEHGRVVTKPLSLIHYGSLALAYTDSATKRKGANGTQDPFVASSAALDLRLQASRA